MKLALSEKNTFRTQYERAVESEKASSMNSLKLEQVKYTAIIVFSCLRVPTTPACTWWNRPEEDNSSGKLESTHPSRTSVKFDQVFFGVESVMRVNADSLLIRAAATSTSGTLNDLTTDLIMANNNIVVVCFPRPMEGMG